MKMADFLLEITKLDKSLGSIRGNIEEVNVETPEGDILNVDRVYYNTRTRAFHIVVEHEEEE